MERTGNKWTEERNRGQSKYMRGFWEDRKKMMKVDCVLALFIKEIGSK